MRNFVEKGDKFLLSSLEDNFLEENCKNPDSEKEKNCIIENHYQIMTRACAYYQTVTKEKRPFEDLSWHEKTEHWSKEKKSEQNSIRLERTPLAIGIQPRTYWRKHINGVLKALDYYKRAMNYSGPSSMPISRIEQSSRAACREAEGLKARIFFIFNTEEYVKKTITDKEELPTGLTELQTNLITWNAIKSNDSIRKDLEVNEYLKSLQYLIAGSNFRHASPYESNKFFQRMVFFSRGDEWLESGIRFKWGDNLLSLAKQDPSYFQTAILQFKASASFSKNFIQQNSLNKNLLIKGRIFESNLKIARAYLQLKEGRKALKELFKAQRLLETVDGRSQGFADKNLLDEFYNLRKEAYIQIGKPELANQP